MNYCNSKGKTSIIKEELLKIWRIYVENRICDQHADILFVALQKENIKKSPSDSKFALLKDETAKECFNEILCLTNTKLTPNGFSLFKAYMMWVNENTIFLLNQDKIDNDKIVTLESFKGLSSLWNIAFKSELQVLKDQAKDCLVEIIEKHYLKTSEVKKKEEMLEKAMEMAFLPLKDNPSLSEVRIALNIIKSIIEKIECIKYEEINSQYSAPPLLEFKIYLKKNKDPEIIFINERMRFSNLKIFLSNKYKINKKRLAVLNYSTKIEYDDKCEYPLANFKRLTENKFLVEEKIIDPPLIETPRFILTNSRIFMKLQDLLKSPNEEIIKEIWNFILDLPLNEEYKARLTKLSLNECAEKVKILTEWENYLQISGNYDSPSLVYQVYILKMSFSGKKDDDYKKYKDLLLQKGGLPFLSEVFGRKRNSLNKILSVKCIECILTILEAYINIESYSKIILNPESEIALWNDILAILEWISKRDGEELDQKTEMNLFIFCCKIHKEMTKINQNLFKEILKKEFIDIMITCS